MRRVLHLGLYSFLHVLFDCGIVSFFIPFLFLLLFLTELLFIVPDGVVGCMLGVGGSIPSVPLVKKSAVVSSFLLYAKPHNGNYVFLSGYSVRITGRLPDV